MKSRNQTGNAHVVIIIILVVALVGALGFVFWQNFMNKSATNTTAETTQQQETTSATKADSKTLAVTEWNIKGSYGGDQTFSYEIFATDPNALLLKKGSSLACGKGVGAVYRLKSDEKSSFFGTSGEEKTAKEIYAIGDVSYQAFIGDYYYFLKDPSTACASDNISDSDRAALIQAVQDFVPSITTN